MCVRLSIHVYISGIGFAICIVATYVSWYYNTIISWALYYFFSSMRSEVPWKTCNNSWNTPNCKDFDQRRLLFHQNITRKIANYTTPNEEFFE